MAKDFAVIQTGGKQYRVSAGDKVKIEKIEPGKDGGVVFDAVLLRSEGGKVEVGTPVLKSTKVEGKILGNGRGKKQIVFKYHSKTRQQKKKGHRREYTEVEIAKI